MTIYGFEMTLLQYVTMDVTLFNAVNDIVVYIPPPPTQNIFLSLLCMGVFYYLWLNKFWMHPKHA